MIPHSLYLVLALIAFLPAVVLPARLNVKAIEGLKMLDFFNCTTIQFESILDKDFWIAEGKARVQMELSKVMNKNLAKNVILFVGDGMGLPTITASRIYKGQLQKENGEDGYHSYELFPDIGLVKVT
jgi:alkaline phosphatase